MTTTTSAHVVERTEDRGLLTIRCTHPNGLSWSVTASSPGDRRWAERSLAGHQGRATMTVPHRCDGCDPDGGCRYDDGGGD